MWSQIWLQIRSIDFVVAGRKKCNPIFADFVFRRKECFEKGLPTKINILLPATASKIQQDKGSPSKWTRTRSDFPIFESYLTPNNLQQIVAIVPTALGST